MIGTDIEIARCANKKSIFEIGEKVGVPRESLIPFGYDKAKLSAEFLKDLGNKEPGNLILVTAINPTPAGEGKTTTTVGLGDALNKIGKKTMMCLREPSLGPCFGIKGGAAGGGYAQVVPMEEINLHFTGDFHAITSAHNLLSAMLDNHIYWGNELGIDSRRVSWKRVLDMNDRALREVVCSLGGVKNGYPRSAGFDISVASEIMAILCLSKDMDDLRSKLRKIVVGYRTDMTPVTCGDLKADGAMAVLLQQAILPNLVQTLENNPVLIHGGPFANIAHGCNSIIATNAALRMADYVVTEAGFGADLGAEKFMDIKCRKAGLKPGAVVIVATIRALKMNGGVQKSDLSKENVDALRNGFCNLNRHIENMRNFGVPVVVAINHFVTDTDEEVNTVKSLTEKTGSKAIVCKHWAHGSAGAEDLAHEVVNVISAGKANFAPLYPDDMSLQDKIRVVAQKIYRASDVSMDAQIVSQLEMWEKAGYRNLPVCMAKTQYSFSADPEKLGAPEGHVLPVREVRLSAGAGFIVVVCGALMTMPGLPKVPSAEHITINNDGFIEGLF